MWVSKDLLCGGLPASQSLLQVVKRLPMVNVTWREPRLMPVKRPGEQAEELLPEGAEPLQQWQLEVRLQRAGGGRAGTSAARVYAPRFPKACLASCPNGYIISIISKSCRGGRVATPSLLYKYHLKGLAETAGLQPLFAAEAGLMLSP